MLLVAVSSSALAQQSSSLGLNVKAAEGAFVRAEVLTVDPNSAAASAGIQAGDLLLYAKGKGGGRTYFADQAALNAWAAEQKAGSAQTVSFVRDGKIKSVKITIPDATQTAQVSTSQQASTSQDVQGLVVKSTDADQAEVVSVAPDSPAAKAGLMAGDVLMNVRGGDGTLFALAGQKDLETWASRQQNGATLELKYMRGAERQSAQITVANANRKIEEKKTAEKKDVQDHFLFLENKGPQQNGAQQSDKPAGKETIQWSDGTTSKVGNAGPSNDKMAKTVTTPNGTPVVFSVKVKTGEIVEVQVQASASAVKHKACWIEDDDWNVDPEVCQQDVTLEPNGVATYRHRAVEPEVFWIQAETADAALGSYTISSRNGSITGQGPAALAIFEAMGTTAYEVNTAKGGFKMKAVARYHADKPGVAGRFILQYEDGSVVQRDMSLDNNGDLHFKEGNTTGMILPSIDGFANFYFKETRVGYKVEDGVLMRTNETLRQYDDTAKNVHLGRHIRNGTVARDPAITPEQVTKLLLDGPGRLLTAKTQRMQDWGVLTNLLGRYWVIPDPQNETVMFWEWENQGASAVGKYWRSNQMGMQPYQTIRLVHNEDDRTINSTVLLNQKGAKPSYETYRRTGDNSVLRINPDKTETIISQAGPNEFAFTRNGQTQIRRALDDTTLKMFVERTRVEQQRVAQAEAAERQRQAQLEAQRRAQEEADEAADMDFLFSLGGSMLDVANGGDFGSAMLNTVVAGTAPELGPVVGGIQGGGGVAGAIDQAFAASLNQAMPGVMDVMQGGAPNMGGGGGSINPYTGLPGPGGAGQIGGGVPGQVEGPNQALGLCPGFTQENYRTHAFNGGNDQQLYALCGQAFELYNIHLNAVRQGYSRADSKMSWDQHVAAVQQIRAWNRGY
jgi:hypothetical protein